MVAFQLSLKLVFIHRRDTKANGRKNDAEPFSTASFFFLFSCKMKMSRETNYTPIPCGLPVGCILTAKVSYDDDNLEEGPGPADKLLTATLTAATALSCLISGLSPCASLLFSSI